MLFLPEGRQETSGTEGGLAAGTGGGTAAFFLKDGLIAGLRGGGGGC